MIINQHVQTLGIKGYVPNRTIIISSETELIFFVFNYVLRFTLGMKYCSDINVSINTLNIHNNLLLLFPASLCTSVKTLYLTF